MPKRKRPAKIPTPAWEARPRIRLGALRTENRWQVPAFLAVVVVVILAVGVIAFAVINAYREEQGRPGQVALRIGDVTYKLGYYTSRLRLFVQQSGGSGSVNAAPQNAFPQVADTLIEEELVRRFAGELGISLTPEEVEEEIRQRLGLSELPITGTGTPAPEATPTPTATPDPAAFATALQQELDRTGFSEQEYRQMVEAQLLIRKIRDKFSAEAPLTAESIHFRQILVQNVDEADAIIARVRGGEDFGEIAKTDSLDTQTRANGGDVGWVPRGALDKAVEDALFVLNLNDVEKYPTPSGVFVFQVVEKAESREAEPQYRPALAGRAYREWLDGKRQAVEIVNSVDISAGDPDKIEWAVRQVYGG